MTRSVESHEITWPTRFAEPCQRRDTTTLRPKGTPSVGVRRLEGSDTATDSLGSALSSDMRVVGETTSAGVMPAERCYVDETSIVNFRTSQHLAPVCSSNSLDVHIAFVLRWTIQASHSDSVFCYSHRMAFSFGPARNPSLPGRLFARALAGFQNRLDGRLPSGCATRRSAASYA